MRNAFSTCVTMGQGKGYIQLRGQYRLPSATCSPAPTGRKLYSDIQEQVQFDDATIEQA